MSKLELIAANTEQELEQNKFEQMPGYYKCNRCKHKWTATLAQMFESPECPKCGK